MKNALHFSFRLKQHWNAAVPSHTPLSMQLRSQAPALALMIWQSTLHVENQHVGQNKYQGFSWYSHVDT